MALIVGVVLGFGVVLFATGVGLDRDRAMYPVAMIVIAAYYVLFAVMGSSTSAILIESLFALAFIVVATWGFRKSLWLVVAALAAHGVFDLSHGSFVANSGVPEWWPHFCLTCDITMAAYLGWLLWSRRLRASA